MLDVSTLASLINNAIGSKDGHGMPISPTPQMKAMASAVVSTLTAGIVNNLIGTVNGVGAPGAPLTAGLATNGTMSLTSSLWQTQLQIGSPTAPPGKLASEADASTAYLMSSGSISFAPGTITGTCTATPLSPGPLAAGAGNGGLIGGLDGDAWASKVLSAQGIPMGPVAPKVYRAIANYVMSNASAIYATGSITGTFAPGGGPLLAGTGSSGTIS